MLGVDFEKLTCLKFDPFTYMCVGAISFMTTVHVLLTAGALAGTEELCKHYCRTGKCKHDVYCRYVHDRSKVCMISILLFLSC